MTEFLEQEVSTEEDFRFLVNAFPPTAKIVQEDGTGLTYGEKDTLTAVTGPDMQADVVGTFDPHEKYGWVEV